MTQQLNFNKLPKLTYNSEEITTMTYEYFQYLVLSFWNETNHYSFRRRVCCYWQLAIAMRQAKA